MAATKTRKPTEIQSATVNRVIDKVSKKVLGYLVKSDSEQGVWYQVTWDRENHRYNCTCPSTKPCKHERAISAVVKARKEIEAEKQAVAEAEKQTTSQPVPPRYCGICKCVGKLHPTANGLTICDACDVQTPGGAAPTATKPVIATKTTSAKTKAPPTIAKRENAPLGSNKTFSLTR